MCWRKFWLGGGISIISQARLAGSPNPHHEVESTRVFSSSPFGILSRPDAFENPACFFLPMIKHQHFIGNPSISMVQPQNLSKFRREILRRRHHPDLHSGCYFCTMFRIHG